ncbi:hypothetical protein [Bradyrhizobium tunisiense]|uniref:hypothetical protein n=1 Tax=Bradyrhizobium tunisiense TaxID=3278709 RepID=UPI0035E240B8
MARKPISGTDLSWIILEELRQDGMSPAGIAIVSGRKRTDWRVVVEARSRHYMQGDGTRRLAAIEKRLQSVYSLAD